MRIGDILIRAGFVSQQQLDAALKNQSTAKKTPLGKHLRLLDFLTDSELDLVLQAQRKMSFTAMSEELAIASLRYARQNGVDFAAASQAVLNSLSQKAKPQQVLSTNSSGDVPRSGSTTGTFNKLTTSTVARFASDPDEMAKLGERLFAQQHFEEAARAYEEARTIYQRSDGYSDDVLIPIYCKLAEIYSKTGKSILAQERVAKLSEIISKGVKLVPGSISSLAQAALLCSKHGMSDQANQLYRSVLPLLAELLPFDHVNFNLHLREAIASSRQQSSDGNKNIRIGELLIGSSLISSDQFQEALQKSKRVRQPLGRVLAESGLVKSQDLRNAVRVQLMCRAAVVPVEYAFFTVKAASYAKVSADEFFKSLNVSFDNPAANCLLELIEKMDCLLLKEESKGVKDPEVALLAAEVADICLRRNEAEEAEIMLRRAHAIFATESGAYQLEMADVCLKIARLLIQKQKYPEAELLLMQSMEIKNRFLGDKHVELADVLLELGFLYFCQGNYGPASGFVRSAWSILQGNCSPEKTRYVLELLIKCFEQMGMENECFIYREQLN